MIKPAYCRLLLGCGVLILAALAYATAPASRASIVPARLQATPAIYEIRSDGSGRRRVGGEGAISFALSKDGSQLAFLRSEPQAAAWSLWVVNRDGSGERRVVAGDAENPILSEFPLAWSPAGDALAFTVFDTAACAPGSRCYQTRAVIVDARDGRRVDDFAGAESLSWSSDGRRMAWACDTEPDPYGEREAVCFTLDRGAPVQRVDGGGIVNRPLWAPGGGRIAFIFEGPGTLRVLDVRRRSIRTLADPASSIDGALTWSPDGRRLAYATAAGELFTVAANGGRQRPRRVGRFSDASSPVWSPSGRRIALLRRRLWTIRPDGTDARRITSVVIRGFCQVDSGSAPSCRPMWSPDGRKLYYLAAS
jgi:Tol biopolymer transport system component